MSSSPKAPPPPDYTGAAQQTAQGNLEAARLTSKANRPNEYTPLGNRIWQSGVGGDPDRWSSIVQLSPLGQQRFDQEQRINSNLGGLAESGLGYVKGAINSPFSTDGLPSLRGEVQPGQLQDSLNTASLPGRQNSLDYSGLARLPGTDDFSSDRDKITQALLDRQQPFVDAQRNRTENQLSNQGIIRGSEAYTNAMNDLGRQENDARLAATIAGGQEQSRLFGMGLSARQQGQNEANQSGMFRNAARDAGFNEAQQAGLFGNQARTQELQNAIAAGNFGNQSRSQGFQEKSFLRNEPLNMLNALRSGSQITLPQFQGYGQQGQTAGPDITGATKSAGDYANNVYNQGVASTNSNNAALGSIAGAGLAAYLAPAAVML